MTGHRVTARANARRRWWLLAFTGWVAVAAAAGLVLMAAFTVFAAIGGLVAVGLTVVLLRAGVRWPEPVGLLVGVAGWLGMIGYLNRGGPGVVCSSRVDAVTCVQHWSPWPFVVGASVLCLATAAALVVSIRRSRADPGTQW